MAFEKIVVLDDELIIRKSLEQQLRRKRYSVAAASTLAEAENILSRDSFDLVFVDVRLPDGDGTELLERLAQKKDSPLVVMITGHGSIESAVDCMRAGAFDYIIKPFSAEQIEVLLKKAESYSQLIKVNQYFSSHDADSGSEIIGETPAMLHLKKMIRKVAATEATVLINGESGTGKELVAREIYRLSPLEGRPYITVNCAAMPESLIESEFFGHEKGAFTGATQRREGRFELANNGTILLDEISEISPRVQAKLLRVLQEKQFERVGGNRTIQVNTRVLATTNRNMLQSVEQGDFREDLYYRLNVFPLQVPALRERREDIPLLAERFLEGCARKHGVRTAGFAAEAIEAMREHDWPGNVRELQNTVERAVILTDRGKSVSADALGLFRKTRVAAPRSPMPFEAEARASREAVPFAYGEVPVNGSAPQSPREQGATNGAAASRGTTSAPSTGGESVLPEKIGPGSRGFNVVEGYDGPSEGLRTLKDFERHHILSALEETGGNRAQAADKLQISIRTLRNKLNQYREEGITIQ